MNTLLDIYLNAYYKFFPWIMLWAILTAANENNLQSIPTLTIW